MGKQAIRAFAACATGYIVGEHDADVIWAFKEVLLFILHGEAKGLFNFIFNELVKPVFWTLGVSFKYGLDNFFMMWVFFE